MRKLITLFALACCGLWAAAQTRTYADNAANTFIFGLDNYFFGASGSLQFQSGGQDFEASIDQGTVSVNASVLSAGHDDTVVGIHDFTGNREAELVVARRTEEGVSATVYALNGHTWTQLEQMQVSGAQEIRVFRQVLSIRSGDVLHSWTWHDKQFDYKRSR